jgi:hypothetical protein
VKSRVISTGIIECDIIVKSSVKSREIERDIVKSSVIRLPRGIWSVYSKIECIIY